MDAEEFASLRRPEREAVIGAVLVRNGVEDLHASGAISDAQAPAFNRCVRQELLQAHDCLGQVDDAHIAYLTELGREAHAAAGTNRRLQCLTGAVNRAVRRFAARELLDGATATALADAACGAVCDEREEDALRSPFGTALLLSCIADWERPELSPEYKLKMGSRKGALT